MWTRFIQNVTDEFASTKEGDLKCHTYYDSGCISDTSLFECFEREGIPFTCGKDNERLYGLLHAYLFNVLINKFGWNTKTENGYEHGGEYGENANTWMLNTLNDSSLFTEEHIYRVFFYRGKAPVDSDRDRQYKQIFKRHKETVEELIHLLHTFHGLVQKGLLKMTVYDLNTYYYSELSNTGAIIDNTWNLGRNAINDKKIAKKVFRTHVAMNARGVDKDAVYETFMNYLKFVLDSKCYAMLHADAHMTTIVKCEEILDENQKLIDLELYIKNSWGIDAYSIYLGKTHHNGMFKIRFSDLMHGKYQLAFGNQYYVGIMFVFPDIEEYAETENASLSKKLFKENLKRDLHRKELDAMDQTLREKARARAEDCRSDRDCIFGKKRTCDVMTKKCYESEKKVNVEKCTADTDCEKNEVYKDCNKRTKKCYTSKTKKRESQPKRENHEPKRENHEPKREDHEPKRETSDIERCTVDTDCEKNEVFKDCNKRTKKCYTSKTKKRK
jgi:hypothetical protein